MKLTCRKCRQAIEIPPEVLNAPEPRVACDQCGSRYRLKSRPGGPSTAQVKTISDLRSRTTPSLPQASPPVLPAASPAQTPAAPSSVDLEDGPTMVSTGGHGQTGGGRRSEPVFRTGEVLAGRYRIVSFIAQGGMGEVYEAEDLELLQSVALKTVSASIGDEPAAVERFKREIALARRVTHPNVCRIFDLGQHASPGASEPVTFLSMELLRGETLSACLRRRGRLSIQEALPLVAQMTAALDAAHGAQVVHRDFKSENVFLVPKPGTELSDLSEARVVVTDFGIARGSGSGDQFAAQVTGLGIVGTPAYMAPEQVENAPEITAAADIYALGIVIYEMVTGKLPFDGGNPLTTAVKRLQEAPPPPHVHVPDLPAWWERAILRCLERRPGDRYAAVTEIPAALEPPTRPVRSTGTVALPAAVLPAASGAVPRPTTSSSLTSLPVTPSTTPPQPAGTPVPAVAAAVAEPTPKSRTALLATVLVVVAAISGVLAWINKDDELDPSRVELRRAVAVLGFENLSGREDVEWLATALGEMFAAELAQTESLRAVGGERVAATRRELAEQWRLGELGPPLLSRIRSLLDCDFVIAGSYVSLGDGGNLRLDVRLLDAALGQQVGSFSEQGPSDDLFAMVDRLGDQLGEALGVDAASSEFSGLPRDAEAAKLYAEGLDDLRAFKPEAARGAFERAIVREPGNPLLHTALASAWDALGFHEKSRSAASRAFELSSGLGAEERLLIEARYRQSERDWASAYEVYRELWQSFPDNLDYGLGLASTSTAAGDAQTALETIDQLRLLPEPLGDDARIDLAEAAAAGLAAQVERQEAAAGRAIAKAEADGSGVPLARALLIRSQAFRALGRLEPAARTATRALGVYRELRQPPGLAEAMTALASAHFDQALFDRAAGGYLEAAEIYRDLGDRGGLAATLNNLAVVRKRQGDFGRAGELYRETETIFEEIGDRRGLAVARNNQAVLLVDRDQLEEALAIFETSLGVWEEAGGEAGRAYALNNMAEVERLRGDLRSSLTRHGEALRIRQVAGLKVDEAISRANLAGVHLELGQLDAATGELEEAAALVAGMQDPTLRSLLDFQRGQVALYAAQLEDARGHHEQAFETREEAKLGALVIASQIALARLALEDGRLLDAEELASTARDQCQLDGRPAEELRASALLIEVLSLSGQLLQAEAFLDEGRVLAEDVQQPAAVLAFKIVEGQFQAASGRQAEAAATLEDVRQLAVGAKLPLLEFQAWRAAVLLDGDEDLRQELEAAAAELGVPLFQGVALD